MLKVHLNLHYIIHTSLEVKGTNIPTVPDSVVYTTTSEPPGMRVVLCREWIVSPTKYEHRSSA